MRSGTTSGDYVWRPGSCDERWPDRQVRRQDAAASNHQRCAHRERGNDPVVASAGIHRRVPPAGPVYEDARRRATDWRPRSFIDLDGHGWQVMWMDPAAAEQDPEAFAASRQDADPTA